MLDEQASGVMTIHKEDSLGATNNSDGNISGNSVELYKRFCQEASCKPNSGFLSFLQERGCTLRLETLSFTSNYFGPQGLLPIIRLIDRCQTLVKIDLENNGADNEAVERLCDVLETHLGVIWLSLRRNPITQKGGRRILQLVENNPRIVYVDISGTNIYETVQEAIYCTVKKHRERLRHCTDLLPADSSTKKLAKELVAQLPPIRQKREHVIVSPSSSGGQISEENAPKPFQRTQAHTAGEGTESSQKGATMWPRLQYTGNGGVTASCETRNSARHEVEYLRDNKERTVQKKRTVIKPSGNLFSRESLLPHELQKIRAQFAERARLFGALQRSELTSVANQARLDLMLVERNATSLPLQNHRSVLGFLPKLEKKGPTKLSLCVAVEKNHEEENASIEKLLPQATESHDSESEKNADRGNMENTNELKAKEEDRRTMEQGVENGETFSNNEDWIHAAPESATSITKDRSVCSTMLEVSHLSQQLSVSSEQQFQALFDQGCREYQHHQLDRAYVAWNEAMSVAVNHKNQEWIAVLTTNLQHITYEIFVKDGKKKLENGLLEDADHCFERALHTAALAKNAKWHSEMIRARQSVKCAEFYKYHKSALELFNAGRQVQDRAATSDDFYLIPTSLCVDHDQEEEDNVQRAIEESCNLSEGIKVQHSHGFVNEWPRIHLVEEAVQTWVEAAKVARKVSPAARGALLDTLNVSLNAVSVFLIQLHFDRKEPQCAPSWQGTSCFTFHECIKLSELYINMIGYNQQHLHHDLFGFLVDLYLGNLALATYDLTHAQQHFTAAVRSSKKMSVEVLEATALSFSATVNIQRANYAVAERELLEARKYWEASIRQEKTTGCPEAGLQLDSGSGHSASVLPTAEEVLKEPLCGMGTTCAENGGARSKDVHQAGKSPGKGSNPGCFLSTPSNSGGTTTCIQEVPEFNRCRARSCSAHSPGRESVTSSGVISGAIIDGEVGDSPSLLLSSAPGITPRFSNAHEAVQFAIPSRYATIMEHADNNQLVTLLTSTYRYQDALETLEYSLLHQHQDLLHEKMQMNFSDTPSLGQLMGVASAIHSNLVYYFISHRYNWSVEKNAYNMEEILMMWVVPYRSEGEMHFVEINVTKEYHTTIQSLVQTARAGMLVDNHIASEKENETDGVVLTTNRKAWITPLECLYSIFLEPIASYIWSLELPLDIGHSVITLIPSGTLWIVPFNALISPHGRYAIEEFGIQLAFCATQAHFATVSVERVRERNLQRSVIVQQMELPTPMPNESDPTATAISPYDFFPSTSEMAAVNSEECTYIRFSLEVEGILEAIRDEKDRQVAVLRVKNTQITSEQFSDSTQDKNGFRPSQIGGAIIAPSTEIVEDLESTIFLMPGARTLHFATKTSYGAPLDEPNGAVGAINIAMPGSESAAAHMSFLRASEISRMELFAEIVTLSNTNIGLNNRGELVQDALGLARAFLSSGSPCVVVSQWCTPDIYPAAVLATLYSKIYQYTNPVIISSHHRSNLVGERKDYLENKTSSPDIDIKQQQNPSSFAEGRPHTPHDSLENINFPHAKVNELNAHPALMKALGGQLTSSSIPALSEIKYSRSQSGGSDHKSIPQGNCSTPQTYSTDAQQCAVLRDSERHKACYLAESVRELLRDPAMRYRPRAWAGYYCIGSGFF